MLVPSIDQKWVADKVKDCGLHFKDSDLILDFKYTIEPTHVELSAIFGNQFLCVSIQYIPPLNPTKYRLDLFKKNSNPKMLQRVFHVV